MATWKPETRLRRWREFMKEVRKLRELVHFLLVGQACYFCGKPLSEIAESWNNHGNGDGPKLTDRRITIHHRDGNHDNNEHSNKVLCHTSCHKSHHMMERHRTRRMANTN